MRDDIEPDCDICMTVDAKHTGDMGVKSLDDQPALKSPQIPTFCTAYSAKCEEKSAVYGTGLRCSEVRLV